MNPTITDKLKEYFRDSSVRVYPKGSILTMAYQEPEGVCFLLEGIVEQYDITPEGNKLVVNVFKPPAFFPMSWAINKTPNAYFFAALTDIHIQYADADKTVAFLQAHPDILFDLLCRVYRGTDALLKRLVLATSSAATHRLILELLIEAYRFGIEQENGKRLIRIKQHTLAARSGLARETISRELRKLRANNLIASIKQDLVVDVEQLEKRLNDLT